MLDFYFILFLKRLDADEKLQYFQLPCHMVSGNKTKLCLKYFYYIDSIALKFTNIYMN